MLPSWFSRMAAVTQRGPSAMKLSTGWPRLANCPGARRRLVTAPSAGATTVLLRRSSRAWSSAASAWRTCALSSPSLAQADARALGLGLGAGECRRGSWRYRRGRGWPRFPPAPAWPTGRARSCPAPRLAARSTRWPLQLWRRRRARRPPTNRRSGSPTARLASAARSAIWKGTGRSGTATGPSSPAGCRARRPPPPAR